jgi:hypothetical protein
LFKSERLPSNGHDAIVGARNGVKSIMQFEAHADDVRLPINQAFKNNAFLIVIF